LGERPPRNGQWLLAGSGCRRRLKSLGGNKRGRRYMKYQIRVIILALTVSLLIPASPGVHAANLSGGSLAAANAAKADDRPIVFGAKWRHSSSAAILTCNKIHRRSERERCLGNMQHPHGVPPKR